MAIHKPTDFHFITLDGNTLQSGGTLSLAKGQVGVFDIQKQTIKGSAAVTEFNKRGIYTIKMGKSPVATTRSAQTSKPWSTVPFKLKNVRDAYVGAPKVKEQKFDILLIGYDGINASTALTFEQGDQTVLDLILEGDPIGELGYKDSYVLLKFYVDVAPDDTRTNKEIVEDLVAQMKDTNLLGGVPLTTLVDITTVDSSKEASAGEGYTFSTLTIVDEGGSNGLGRVQAQYPDYIVKRTDRSGLTSVYTILAPTADTIAPYTTELAQILKGCEDCLAGYSELEGGFVYSVSLEDDGADSTSTVQAIPGAVAGSAAKIGQDYGVGKYTVVTDDELTDAEITTFITANPTADVALLGDVVSVCNNATVTSTAWVDGDECFADVATYKIQLPDTDCGESRLAELQAHYAPYDLTIVEGAPSTTTSEVTLSGTSGSVTITVNGSDYTAAFDTDLATTASAFVTAEEANLAAQTPSVTVSAAGDVLTFTSAEGVSVGVVTASGDLAGDVVVPSELQAGGCQRVYSTTVATSVVCDECDPAFNELFVSEAPEDFEIHAWEKIEEGSAEALMGIRVAGKPFVMDPSEALVDEVPFYETSVRLKAAAGYPTDVNVSFKSYNNPWNVEWIERAQDRDYLGYNFRIFEEISRVYFDGAPRHECNNFAKAVLGEESLLKNRAQYVDYTIVIGKDNYAQEQGGREDTAIAYHIVAEVGRHQEVEDLINGIAVAAGLDPVQAFPVA